MYRQVRTCVILAAPLGAWFVLSFVLVPALLTSVFASGAAPRLTREPLDFFLEQWESIVWYGTAAGVAVTLFVRRLPRAAFALRFVPAARPSDLGAIRMLVAGILLISTLWEDVSSTAALPREMMDPPGVLRLLAALPFYDDVAASPTVLRAYQAFTALVLFCAAIGWKTRLTVGLGSGLYLVLGGLLRQYSSFYHTGLIPLYLLTVLAFLPCGHGLSVDRFVRRKRGFAVPPDVPGPRYGWARYAVWLTLAVPYVAAGLSKVRNGGLFWWDASNFRFILYQSTLRPMQFDFELSLALASAPDWIVEALALSAILGELLYGLTLFSRRARWIMPAVMLLMHGGILFLQNILFFDLLLLQLIFLNFRPIVRAASVRLGFTSHTRPAVHRRHPAGGVIRYHNVIWKSDPRAARRVATVVMILLTVCWVFRVEFYPFTGMQMFSGKRTEPVVYERVLAHTRAGDVIRAPVAESIGAMSDGRYRRLLARAFTEDDDVSRAFFDAVADRWNRQADYRNQIARFELQRWEWFFLSQADDPDYGRLIDKVVYPAGGEETMER